MLPWRRVAVPAFLGVLGLIWVAAHALAHDVVAQPSTGGHSAHGATAETYVAYLPTSLALCLTLAVAIAACLALGKRWAGRFGRSLWLFGVVPVLGFAADTLVELGANGPTVAAGGELVPAFLVGLLVQLPFALVAVGLGGKLLWLAERLAWALRAAIVGLPVALFAPASAPAAGPSALRLAGSCRSRAPPGALS
ncbi:MAG: hypothetical protein ACRDMY_00170 [Gaiellaceae bacterium]